MTSRKHALGKYLVILLFVSVLFSVLPGIGHAAYGDAPPLSEIDTPKEAMCLFYKIAVWIFWFAIVFLVGFGIVAAINYAASGGDVEKMKKATWAFGAVVVSAIVAILSWTVPQIAASLLNTTIDTTC